jgi:hypothetical protein
MILRDAGQEIKEKTAPGDRSGSHVLLGEFVSLTRTGETPVPPRKCSPRSMVI